MGRKKTEQAFLHRPDAQEFPLLSLINGDSWTCDKFWWSDAFIAKWVTRVSSSFSSPPPPGIHCMVLSLDCSDLFLASVALTPAFRVSLLCFAVSRNFGFPLSTSVYPRALRIGTGAIATRTDLWCGKSTFPLRSSDFLRDSHELFWCFPCERVSNFGGFLFCKLGFDLKSQFWLVATLRRRGFGGFCFVGIDESRVGMSFLQGWCENRRD